MRVLLGLAALAATVNGQTVTLSSSTGLAGVNAQSPLTTSAQLSVKLHSTTATGAAITTGINPNTLNTANFIATNNWGITVPNGVQNIGFELGTNPQTAQLQYRTYPGSGTSSVAYTCDTCASGCSTTAGPTGTGYPCSSLARTYLVSGFPVGVTTFQVTLFDTFAASSSYLFTVTRQAAVTGDPQIQGMQGQDFQVHGMPDEIFNMVSSTDVQVNARFTYLESGSCRDNYTACFAHPGTYISEEGIRIGADKVRVTAGSHKKGLTVHLNGKKVTSSSTHELKSGSVEVVNHRRVIVNTKDVSLTITNSDKFLNQEMSLVNNELIKLGATRRVLKDNERFHSEVPMHGLQGQTWRNVEYPSGLEYEGSIMDYHVVSGNLFGTDFVFNQFQQ